MAHTSVRRLREASRDNRAIALWAAPHLGARAELQRRGAKFGSKRFTHETRHRSSYERLQTKAWESEAVRQTGVQEATNSAVLTRFVFRVAALADRARECGSEFDDPRRHR